MPPHSVGTGTISFGLVSIPIKLYTAASSESVSFNMLHAKCGNRIKQQTFCPTDNEVVVRTEIKGKGDPIQLDYRLEKAGDSWKIYDVNVLGVWLVENYRNSFAQEIGANGIDGLIAKMAERNKSAAAAGAKS